MFRSIFLLSAVLFITGCASTESPYSEFVRSIDFSPLDTYHYKHTMTTGTDWAHPDAMILTDLSEEVICGELNARGFAQAGEDADFFIVTKWKKAVSAYPNISHPIDGPTESLRRRDDPTYRFAARVHLTLEIYETATKSLFWRKELPDIFDTILFTEQRVTASLERAIKNFPERVEKDPNLPSIQ